MILYEIMFIVKMMIGTCVVTVTNLNLSYSMKNNSELFLIQTNCTKYFPDKMGIVTLNKAVNNYLPNCTCDLLYE